VDVRRKSKRSAEDIGSRRFLVIMAERLRQLRS
jgi:hypothetical protein